MNNKNCGFLPAEILIPDFNKESGTKWASVACDQFTSEPEYWEAAADIAGDAPSTLNLMIPEVYLAETEERLPRVHKAMEDYLKDILVSHPDSLIYIEREQSDGRIRKGLVGMVDLEHYDYNKGATSLIRATEGTVLERIPPRVAVRRGAKLELPHIMLLIDDPDRTVIERLAKASESFEKAYDFDLMLGGGHIKGCFVSGEYKEKITDALASLATTEEMEKKYGAKGISPLLFAVGDGNHSLASAKAAFEEIKAKDGEKAMNSPARYALAEVVNLHDEALDFEPIYRVVFDVDGEKMLSELREYAKSLKGSAAPQTVHYIVDGNEGDITFESPVQQLAVGTLQDFLDTYKKKNPEAEIDYIHDESSLRALAEKKNSVGFLFDGMGKDELFKTVIFDGALPRKTFSMGHARDKRFYLECRKIK